MVAAVTERPSRHLRYTGRNALRPLVEIPELDEVFIDRKINAGDRGFLALTKPA
jgi:hypothetical protein